MQLLFYSVYCFQFQTGVKRITINYSLLRVCVFTKIKTETVLWIQKVF